MDDAARGSEHAIDPDSDFVGFARGPHQGKGSHGCPKEGHQQQKGTDRMARQQIIAFGTLKHPARSHTKTE